MADEQWISFDEAAEIIRSRLGGSVGRAEAEVRKALKSGEIRGWSFNDDGLVNFSLRPGTLNRTFYSHEDFADWLDRVPPANDESTAAKTATGSGTQYKRDRAKEAVTALWGDQVPKQTDLANDALCQQVADWLKQDYKNRGLPSQAIGNDTILRAAGRKQ